MKISMDKYKWVFVIITALEIIWTGLIGLYGVSTSLNVLTMVFVILLIPLIIGLFLNSRKIVISLIVIQIVLFIIFFMFISTEGTFLVPYPPD